MTPEEKLKLDLMMSRTKSAEMGIGSEEVDGKIYRGLIQPKQETSQPTYYEKMIEPMYKASINPKVPDIVRAQIFYENPLVQMMQKQKSSKDKMKNLEDQKRGEAEGMNLLEDVHRRIQKGKVTSPDVTKKYLELINKLSDKT